MKKLLLFSTAVITLTVAPFSTIAQINIFSCGTPNTPCPTSPCDSYSDLCISGGTPPYTYLWSPNGQTTLNLSGVCPGQYTLSVTDAVGTTAIDSLTLTQPIPLSVSVTLTANASCNGCCDGSASGSVSGGTPVYTYVWFPSGGQTPTETGMCVGTYSLCVYDINGCYSCDTVTITQPNNITETISSSVQITISPNPFSTQTVLQTDNPLHNATLTVDNCFGQTVAQIKNLRGQTITFNRDNLASGLYFVRLTEENKTIAVDKFVITDK